MSEKNQAALTPIDMAIDNKFINQLSAQLTQKQEFGLTFPANYNVTNALNTAYLMIKEMTVKKKQGNDWIETPVLDLCTKQSVAAALIDMTTQGLHPGKKQCYFILYKDRLTLRRSYQGTMAVAKRVGVLKTPVAQIIYEGDTFEYHIENGLYVVDKHVQDFMSIDNTKIKGAYAIVETGDGQYVEIMNINQIRSAWKKGTGYDPSKQDSVHVEFTDQMCKKTVINRACKNIINSSDDANLAEAFDNTTGNEDLDVVAGEVQHDIESNANTEEFELPPDAPVEKVQGEVVGEPKKPEQARKDSKPANPPVQESEAPEWMPR